MPSKKFAIIGTSCSGKTTLCYALVSQLKTFGVLADGVFSQDRKFSFDKALLPVEEVAQHWMIANLIAKECDASLQSDIECLISDRSALDLFAYYQYQAYTMPSPMLASLKQYVLTWMSTYDAVFYLEPLPYQDDNKRPSDEFRMGVDAEIRELIKGVPNVYTDIPRNKVLENIMLRLGKTKPNVKTSLEEEEVQYLANVLGLPVSIKNKDLSLQNKLVTSDVDLFIEVVDDRLLVDARLIDELDKRVAMACKPFGPWVSIDTVFVYPGYKLPPNVITKTPEV